MPRFNPPDERELNAFMRAIFGNERDPRAGTQDSQTSPVGAAGKYQFMPATWDDAVRRLFPGQKLNIRNSADQDKVARALMTEYYQKYGAWDLVAAAWQGGPGAANQLFKGDASPLKRSDGHWTIQQYITNAVIGMSKELGRADFPVSEHSRAVAKYTDARLAPDVAKAETSRVAVEEQQAEEDFRQYRQGEIDTDLAKPGLTDWLNQMFGLDKIVDAAKGLIPPSVMPSPAPLSGKAGPVTVPQPGQRLESPKRETSSPARTDSPQTGLVRSAPAMEFDVIDSPVGYDILPPEVAPPRTDFAEAERVEQQNLETLKRNHRTGRTQMAVQEVNVDAMPGLLPTNPLPFTMSQTSGGESTDSGEQQSESGTATSSSPKTSSSSLPTSGIGPDALMALSGLAYTTDKQISDLNLRGQRLVSDYNLFQPFIQRRFGNQQKKVAAGLANRGFAGSNQGITAGRLSELTKDQTFESGQIKRRAARELTDIERAIASLSGESVIEGANIIYDDARRVGF